MRAHSDNAQLLAEWLAEHSLVEAVHYCGLADHPGHALAVRQQKGFGGVLAFEVAGGREAAWQFINGTELMSLTANLGDAKTTIVHPASTTHGRLTARQRGAAGISEGLVRIAVGLEDLEDLQSDCLRGFAALSP
jgi:O-succinylhomoserine sulfhydrylase